MKKVIILLSLLCNLFGSVIEMPLSRLAGLVASEHKINIVINKSVDLDSEIIYVESLGRNMYLLSTLRLLLNQRGYNLIFDGSSNYYYVEKQPDLISKPHFIKLKTPIYDDLASTLDLLGVTHAYIPNTHSLTYFCNDLVHKQVLSLVKSNDIIPEQFSLKITIVETNINKINNRGADLQLYASSLSGASQSFLNLLTTPFSSNVNTFEGANLGFTGVLKFLNQNSLSDIRSSPIFTVQSNKKISFAAVQNIPYKKGSTSVNGATETQTEQIDYLDIGLKINLMPKMVLSTLYIDLDLTLENILDKSTLTPSTSKRSLVNSFQLKRGEVLVLSGINQDEEQNLHYGIPFLESLPFIGSIFSFDSKELINRNLTISIEVI